MSEEYTPTTVRVQVAAVDGALITQPEFDRWLTSVKAEAWEEGHKARQQEEQSEYEQIAFGSEREPFPEVLKITNPYRQ